MAWQSTRDVLALQLMELFPGISRKTAGALSYAGGPNTTIGELFEWVRTASDNELLDRRGFGFKGLQEVQAARAALERYGQAARCNWVGEGVPA